MGVASYCTLDTSLQSLAERPEQYCIVFHPSSFLTFRFFSSFKFCQLVNNTLLCCVTNSKYILHHIYFCYTATLNTAGIHYSSACLRSEALDLLLLRYLLHPSLHLLIRVRHMLKYLWFYVYWVKLICQCIAIVLLLYPYGGFACLVPWFCITACMYKIQGTSPNTEPFKRQV